MAKEKVEKHIVMDSEAVEEWNEFLEKANIRTIESLEIDHSGGLPVWIQVKNRLSFLIASGEYSAGDRLPTVRALAVDLDISYNTVNRAYMDLEREGYITTRKGRGTFVADVSERSTPAVDETVTMLADEMIRSGINVGMNDDDIISLVKSRLQKKS